MGKKDVSDKMVGLSKDVTSANRETLRAAFPGCFADGRVDWATLAALCGENSEDAQETPILRGGVPEKYAFEWPGKRDALRAVGRRSAATLRPVPSESVDFETTRNVYIEGDNLEVLRLLQESYFRKVKTIYIDPPYNTGNDFVYNDDFADPWARYLELTSQTTKSNPETAGRFHSNWLNMIYPRLRLAANLLRDDGVIFISIDDREVCNLRKICDEIFGEENFVAQLVWERAFSPKNDAKYISNSHDYVLMYAKSLEAFKIGRLPRTAEANARYQNPDNDPRGPWTSSDISVKTYNAECDYPITTPSGATVEPPPGRCWSLSKKNFEARRADNRIWFGPDGSGTPRMKRFLSELKFDGMAPTSLLFYKDVGHSQEGAQEVVKLLNGGVFNGPKPTRLLKRLLTLANLDKDSIVLDFFSGSGTTAHAVMKLNAEDGGARRFILVQLPELCADGSEAAKAGYRNICEIGKERLRRAGAKLREERAADLFADDAASLDVGFKVFRLDTSNWELWDDSPTPPTEAAAFLARLRDSKNARKLDRSDADVLTEVALKSGLPLDAKFETLTLVNVAVYVERDARFCALLQDGAEVEDVERLLEAPKSKRPEKIVVAESAFRSDAALANVARLLEENGIEAKFI